MEQFRKGVLTHPCQCPSGRRYRRSTQPSLCCGTATILKEYVDSTKDPDSTAPRIFWLQNQDAKGRSPIANTIAPHAQNRGQLGSCFCSARERQAERLHEKLFPTIARDFAARDIRLRPTLADALAVDSSLGSACDAAILRSSGRRLSVSLKGPIFGNVVIVLVPWTRVAAIQAASISLGTLGLRRLPSYPICAFS